MKKEKRENNDKHDIKILSLVHPTGKNQVVDDFPWHPSKVSSGVLFISESLQPHGKLQLILRNKSFLPSSSISSPREMIRTIPDLLVEIFPYLHNIQQYNNWKKIAEILQLNLGETLPTEMEIR